MDTTTALRLRPYARAAFERFWTSQISQPNFRAHRKYQEVYRDPDTEKAWQAFWRGYKACHGDMMSLVVENS